METEDVSQWALALSENTAAIVLQLDPQSSRHYKAKPCVENKSLQANASNAYELDDEVEGKSLMYKSVKKLK